MMEEAEEPTNDIASKSIVECKSDEVKSIVLPSYLGCGEDEVKDRIEGFCSVRDIEEVQIKIWSIEVS